VDNELTMPPAAILVIVLAVVFMIASAIWYYRRAQSLLQRWADENGLQIMASQHRILDRGPFFWTTGRGQVVYYVTVVDAAGRTRRGYVRCGSFWGGLLSDKTEVRWDESA